MAREVDPADFEAVLDRLLANGNRPDLARLYASSYCLYHDADEQTRAAPVLLDRTMKPAKNLYAEIRASAMEELERLSGKVRHSGLW